MLQRPPACSGCPLDSNPRTQGFVPPSGPVSAPILFMGEAAGEDEARTGVPFSGAAGGMLNRLLGRSHWDRRDYRIANVISCFPGDTLVQAEGIQRGYRRWYVGDVITVRTGDGVLTGTPNHPVLTAQGWVALGELHCGDELIRGFVHPWVAWGDPDVQNCPAQFAKVFDALADAGITARVVGRDVDFHGDGFNSEVDVVTPHRVLGVHPIAPFLKEPKYFAFQPTYDTAGALVTEGAPFLDTADVFGRERAPQHRLVGGRYEGRTPLRVQVPPARQHRLAAVADRYPGPGYRQPQSPWSDAVLDRQRFKPFPIPIAAAEVLEIERTAYSGHVYNLQTLSEQYVANGFIVHNCRPANNWFDERAPWYWGARQHCAVHRDPVLAEGHKVIVALGGTALKTLVGLDKGIRVEDWHGVVAETPHGLVIPTFHPSHLQRGAHNLFGVVSFDLQQAHRVAREGWVQETPDILVDPPVDWFTFWVAQVESAVAHDPESVWLAVDIETPDKSEGQDEGELSSEDRSYTILRVNFSVHPDEGVTVPYAGPYVALIDRLLQLVCTKLLWNAEYDRPRLEAAGHPVKGAWLDFMWFWHFLQSDLPRGLGFAAPFYSRFGAWKHLAKGDPGRYAAIDGFQTYRIATGVARDLQAAGQWDTAVRHIHRLHEVALRPAQQVGLLISRERLTVFIADLEVKQRRILHQMQGLVPEEVRPLTPKGGYKREPEEGKVHSKGTAVKRDGTAKKEAPDPVKQDLYAQTAVLVSRVVRVSGYRCQTCGESDLQKRHRCAGKGDPDLHFEEYEAERWYWQEPFNPDSPDQILTYMKAKGHKPGRGKKTGADSTDKDTLQRLAKETKDPLYQAILDSRAVGKVRGTYGVGTRKLMDGEDRVHPVPTFRPSTMRLCVAQGTPVEVLRDVAAFPKGIPIEQLTAGDWAYTYDDNRHLTLRRIVWVGQTGLKAVVRVSWAGSNRRKERGYVDLTPEHEVRLTTGEYRQAQHLVVGDRVLSLARGADVQKGYTLLYITGQTQPKPEHRYAYVEITGTHPGHVHHKNERKVDNRFDNLVGLGVGEHFRHHNTGEGNPRWREGWPVDPNERRRQSWAEYRERRRVVNNHRILSVELLPGLVPVYDLEVEETHNFIGGELCLHNSYTAPNVTNVVADKGGEEGLASGFRRCVVAGERLPKWVTPEGLKAWERKWTA